MTGPSTTQELIAQLKLQPHSEGGYFVETDRQQQEITSPYAGAARPLATTIYYLLAYGEAIGALHLNKSVIHHVLHQGRAEYTLIYPGTPPRIEKIILGTDVTAGEQRQLVVGSGVWKMSKLLDEDIESATTQVQKDRTNCLITEVVVPGFVYEDQQFLTLEGLQEIFKNAEGGAERIREFAPFVKTFA